MTPNLDAMSGEELSAFLVKYQYAGEELVVELVGKNVSRPMKVCGDLCRYALHKEEAIRCRLMGSIGTAGHHEDVCDAIYSKLPVSVRW